MINGLDIAEPNKKYSDRIDYLKDKLKVNTVDDYLDFKSEPLELRMRSHKRAIEELKNNLANSNMGILPDPDADGYTSTAILCNIFNFKHIYHREEKVHGLDNEIVATIIDSGVEYVVLPDSSTNDLELCKELNNNGIKTIIIDHHQTDVQKEIEEYEKKSDKYFIINNQFGMMNKHLTGAGLCFFVASILVGGEVNRLSHLASIGQVGDSSDISDLQIRSIVYNGINNVSELLSQFDIESAMDLSYSIIPIINATLRVGILEDKKLLLDLLIGKFDGQTEIVKKRKKDKKTGKMPTIEIEQSKVKTVTDNLSKVRNKQRKIVGKMAEEVPNNIVENDRIGLSIATDIEHRSTTGLVAMQMVEKYEKPFLYLVEKDGKLSGSVRSDSEYNEDFREWCQSLDCVELAQGHPHAFGFSIDKDNLSEFIEKTSELNKNSSDIKVDFLFKGQSDRKLIESIYNNQQDFGGNVPNPTIGIKGLKVNKKYFNQMGKVLTFYHDGVEFIWYKAPLDLIEEIKYGFDQHILIDVIGKSVKNEWRGSRKGRFSIDKLEIDVEPVEEDFDYIVF